ncbi:MAG TPA: TIGR03790 family protein [Armatimonadota bacterium]|nr:TIGR03790 family protein [Armatimonadota bacterium]
MSPHLLHFRAIITAITMVIAISCAFAGGGPQNVLIVANTNSTESLEIANAYRRVKNIPYSNVVTLTTATTFQVPYQTYLDEIEEPIRSHLKNHQLTDDITDIVLTRGVPQMITADNGRSVASLLAAMNLSKGTPGYAQIANPYYNASDAFSHQLVQLKGMYMVTVLNGYNVADVLTLIANGKTADESNPNGRFVLQTIPRYVPPANDLSRMLAIRNLKSEVVTTLPENRHEVMGYFSGGAYSGLNQDIITSFQFLPGAIADLAQYFSAAPDNFDQIDHPVLVPVSWFVQAGITGIHGVIGESGMKTIPVVSAPQQLFGKYTDGFSLAESFYSALPVLNWQNIVIGDPLCSPYAKRPLITVDQPSGQLQGILPIRITATSPNPGTTISRIDAYIDDRFAQTIYQPDKTRITLYIGEEVVHYMVPHGATLRTLLDGLADAINSDPILSAPDGVRAVPSLGTSTLTLVARRPGADNNEIPIGIDIETDPPTAPCIMARVDGGWMSGGGQDPTPASAVVSFMGRHAKAGDEIDMQIQQQHFSYVLPADSTISADIPAALAKLINEDPVLKEADGVLAIPGNNGMPYLTLQARTPGEHGNVLSYRVTVKPVAGSRLHAFPENPAQFTGGYDGSASVQNIHFMLGEVTAKGTYFLNTADLIDGYHRLTIVAYDGSLAQTQGNRTVSFTVHNTETPPVVTLPDTLPPSSSSITIPVTATPSVAKVDIYVDGQLLGSSTTAPFEIRIPLAGLGRGIHDLWAEASDANGHHYLTAPIPLQVLTPPEVFHIIPNYTAASGGTVHKIVGTGFQRNAIVRLAGIQAREVKYISPNVLEVTADAGPARQGWVEVVNPDATVSLPTIGFEYYQPRIDEVRITPEHEVLAPGRKVQFTASCFDQHNFPIQANVNWESNGGNISSKGLFTAGKTTGTYLIRVSCADGKTVWDTPISIGPAIVPNGRLQHWLTIGPFPDPDYSALEASQIPETTILPSHGDVTGTKTWQSLYSANGYIDLLSNMSPNTNVVAYAHIYIQAPFDTSCSLIYGSDDGIRIWLNGTMMQSLRIRRAPDPNQNTTPITLRAGWNRLLVKVDQGTGSWGFFMRLRADAGTNLPLLRYSLDCPADYTGN